MSSELSSQFSTKHIRTKLKKKYGLRTKPRERSLIPAKDIDYLLQQLFTNDFHEYFHERARIQTASSLSLSAGSGARVGAIVESSAYRKKNQCFYYRVRSYAICYWTITDIAQHMKFHLKWGQPPGTVKRWVTIGSEFLKGLRFRDDKQISVQLTV